MIAASPLMGLSAFPLTPSDAEGVVNVAMVGKLVDRLAGSSVDSIGLLGSTGAYAYLERSQRSRALSAGVEALAGRLPLIVGVGSMRTSWSIELAREAERFGADAVLLAPVSYTPLSDEEVLTHFEAVAGATGLPLCVYNNPGTTHFRFTEELIGRIAALPNVVGVKMPAPAGGDFNGELRRLRVAVGSHFSVGYSGDWNLASAMSGGANAFYSALAGTLPAPAVRLMRAVKGGRAAEAATVIDAITPLWELCRSHGSFRIAYSVARHLGLSVGRPPAPVRLVDAEFEIQVSAALERLHGFNS